MNLTNLTFEYCKDLPKKERYNLIDQINRCSCSIPSNIAEGSGKRTKLQFGEYLSISISSSYELETQLYNLSTEKLRKPRTIRAYFERIRGNSENDFFFSN